MRKIDLKVVSDKIKDLFIDACENIPENVLTVLKEACEKEESPLGKQVLEQIVENAYLGREKHLPICQDTGLAIVYLTIGSEVYFEGDIYDKHIKVYLLGFLRDERRFESLEELKMQINIDKNTTIKENGDIIWQYLGLK